MNLVKKIITVLYLTGVLFSCQSQHSLNSILMKDPRLKITPNFETFDVEKYNDNLDKNGRCEYFKTDSTFIKMDGEKGEKFHSEIPPNSYFEIAKSYYPNGNIKEKGLYYKPIADQGGFLAGVWYEFNEQGKLVKTLDYDKYFKFTFEDILLFCKEDSISIRYKTSDLGKQKSTTRISRDWSEITGGSWWQISKVNVIELSEDYTEWVYLFETIRLDGNTGKVLSREEYFVDRYFLENYVEEKTQEDRSRHYQRKIEREKKIYAEVQAYRKSRGDTRVRVYTPPKEPKLTEEEIQERRMIRGV